MREVANPKRRPVVFKVGEKAWLRTEHLPLRLGTRKLAAKFAGPFRVIAEVAPEAYRLALPAAWNIHDVFHTSQLKEVSGNPPETEAVEVAGETEFEVERVLASRIVRGKTEFLVKWLGFGDHENSWEPAENLGNA